MTKEERRESERKREKKNLKAMLSQSILIARIIEKEIGNRGVSNRIRRERETLNTLNGPIEE